MKATMILFAAALLAGCAQGDKPRTAAIDTANFDTTANLKADFYRYVTGGWQAKNPLRPEYSRFGAFDVLSENNQHRIKELFASLAEERAERGSVQQKITDLYQQGLDSTRLNREGAEPLREDLERIRNAQDRSERSRLLGWMHAEACSAFFTPYVDADAMNSTQNVLSIYQSGLGLGDRDYYLKKENASILEAYRTYLQQLFGLVGYTEQEATRAAASTIEVERKLAEAAYSQVELRDPYRNYNRTTLGDMRKTYDAIDWDAYFEALNGAALPDTTAVIVGQLPAMERANELLATLPAGQLSDYIAAHYISAAACYLGDDFIAAYFELYNKTLSGQQQQKPRWKRALSVPNQVLSEAVGQMYVQKYFPPENKERMLGMVRNLQTALGEHIDRLAWMSDQTKGKAHEKLDRFIVKIGYPDQWKDYTTLEIDPSLSYWTNIKRANRWDTDDQMSEQGKPVDRGKWFMSPQTVNAYYNPTTNEICFPAAILQPPFFNPEADDAVNYGAIGVVIGHEMTHGFDDQGRQFDKDGNLSNWWTEADAAAFSERAAQLAAQFDAIEVLPGVQANGKLTLGENIADQGGLNVAYTALQHALSGTEAQPVDGYTPAQRFYLSYATLWAQNIRDEEIARLTRLDPHSLGRLRVNATLRNIGPFFEAFGIGPEDGMYRAPEERVVIW